VPRGSSNLKYRRRWIAALLALVLVVSQAVAAAHACPITDRSIPFTINAANVIDAMPHCGEAPGDRDSNALACATHCLPERVVHADAPTAPLASQPALFVRLVDLPISSISTSTALASSVTAPPPRLRFSRLLI
jgi:hypothetical protein